MKHCMAKAALVALAFASVGAVAAPSSRVIFKDSNFSSGWKFSGGASRDWSDGWHTNRVIQAPVFQSGDAEYLIKMPANYRPGSFKYKLSFQARSSYGSCIGGVVVAGLGEAKMQGGDVGTQWKDFNFKFDGLPQMGSAILVRLHLCGSSKTQIDNVSVTEISKN